MVLWLAMHTFQGPTTVKPQVHGIYIYIYRILIIDPMFGLIQRKVNTFW